MSHEPPQVEDTSKILTGGNDCQATVFNKDTEQVVAILKGHRKKVTRVVYHPSEVRFGFSNNHPNQMNKIKRYVGTGRKEKRNKRFFLYIIVYYSIFPTLVLYIQVVKK